LKYTHHKAEPQDAGQRLDRFLGRLYPRVTKSLWQKALRQRDVRVNGRVAKPDDRVCAGDEILIFSGLLNVSDNVRLEEKSIDPSLADALKAAVLYQGDGFSVVNKPKGVACQGGLGVRVSLDRALPLALESPIYLVHRLDKETSGALLVTHTPQVAAFFAKNFQVQRISKTYLALLKGHLPTRVCGTTYTSWVRKEPKGCYESMMCFDSAVPGAQEARTRFEVLETSVEASLVRMIPETGRKHQLRVQAAHLGAPIWGDDRYGVKRREGLCLHALELRFLSPKGAMITVTAPPPEHFQQTARALGLSYDITGAKTREQRE
jgi:23S rRNA pseudouridine955/2504/2580 synthase